MKVNELKKAERHPAVASFLQYIQKMPENEIKTRIELVEAGIVSAVTFTRCAKMPTFAPYLLLIPRGRIEGIFGHVVGKPKAIAAVKKLVEETAVEND